MQRTLPAPARPCALLSALLCALLAPSVLATPVATTEHFAFHSDSRINLHHFLYQWAVAEEAEAREAAEGSGEGERRRRRLAPVPVAERGEAERLSEEERAVWSDALRAYRRHAVDRRLLFSREMWDFRDALTGGGPPPAELAAVRRALEAALPVYRRHWWPEHDLGNRRWIADLLPALVLHGGAVVERLEAAYGSTWPAAPVHVDVSAYAHFLGAYTVGPGPRSTISSTRGDYRMPRAFEMVFHEASHGDLFEPVRQLLRQVYAERGAEHPPRDLWHAILFYTAGEVARQVLEDAGVTDGYRTYAEYGLWDAGHWADHHAALRRHWQPYLDGGTADLRLALERVAEELAGEGR